MDVLFARSVHLGVTGLQAMPGDMRPLPTEEGKPGRWVQRKFVGCRPGINCRKVGCQKQSFGIELDGIHLQIRGVPFRS